MLSYTVLPKLCGHVKEFNDLIANVQHIVVSVSFSFFSGLYLSVLAFGHVTHLC